jgi:hypothetical protein
LPFPLVVIMQIAVPVPILNQFTPSAKTAAGNFADITMTKC